MFSLGSTGLLSGSSHNSVSTSLYGAQKREISSERFQPETDDVESAERCRINTEFQSNVPSLNHQPFEFQARVNMHVEKLHDSSARFILRNPSPRQPSP